MTGRIEKTVFISYRRTNSFMARAVYQSLTLKGYDVFFDYEGIDSGDFEQIILGNLRARAHFLAILTPSALERCNEVGDWFRREIETAIDEKRNIVPLFFEGFNFGSSSIAQYLTGKLTKLKNYNGLNVPSDYFNEAMDKLVNRFLNVPLDAVLHPLSNQAKEGADAQKAALQETTRVTEDELSAEEWFEKGHESSDPDEKIYCYNEAIRLKPDYVSAFNARGMEYLGKGDMVAAMKDWAEAERLTPDFAKAVTSGNVHRVDGKFDAAIKDYDKAIHLKPDFAEAFFHRGLAHYFKHKFDAAIQDYNEAIRLKPDWAEAFTARGAARQSKGDLDAALNDYNEAIRLKPDYAPAYNARGAYYFGKKDLDSAIRDFEDAIRLDPELIIAKNNLELARSQKK